jgi:dTMP kinase
MIRSGKFIIIEGVDGSGKDTQAEMLALNLQSKEREVLVTGSPTTWYRSNPLVASFIERGETPLSQDTLAAIGAADRMMQIDREIIPAIKRGIDVICVRYVYSAFGYFHKRGANMQYVEAINSLTLTPTHGLLLMLNPQDAVQRVRKRDGKVSFEEQAEYLNDVQTEMMRRWPSHYLMMNAALPREQIAEALLSYVTS